MSVLSPLFTKLFKTGRLTVIDARGRRTVYGGVHPGPEITIRLHDRGVEWRLATNPRMAAGEAYMNGRLTVENAEIYDFLDLCALNTEVFDGYEKFDPLYRLERLLRTLQQINPIGRAQKNVAHHYDLSGKLYDLFLDNDRQYSCAYFHSPDEPLET